MLTPTFRSSRLPLTATITAALGLLAGCNGATGHVTYLPQPQVVVIFEEEPNNTFFSPQGIGPVFGGDSFTILGHSDFFDADGYAFLAQEDIDVYVTLDGHNPFANLDLCVYDPIAQDYILCEISGSSDEQGSFTVSAGFEFHVVISSVFAGSDYDLDIDIHPFNGLLPFSADGEEGGGAVRSLAQKTAAATFERYDAELRVPFERYVAGHGAQVDEPATDDDAAALQVALLLPGIMGLPARVSLLTIDRPLAPVE